MLLFGCPVHVISCLLPAELLLLGHVSPSSQLAAPEYVCAVLFAGWCRCNGDGADAGGCGQQRRLSGQGTAAVIPGWWSSCGGASGGVLPSGGSAGGGPNPPPMPPPCSLQPADAALACCLLHCKYCLHWLEPSLMATDAADLQSMVCRACQARQTSTMMPSRQQVLAGCSWLPPPPVPMRPDLLLPQPVAAAAAAETDVGQGPHDAVRTATSPHKRQAPSHPGC